MSASISQPSAHLVNLITVSAPWASLARLSSQSPSGVYADAFKAATLPDNVTNKGQVIN